MAIFTDNLSNTRTFSDEAGNCAVSNVLSPSDILSSRELLIGSTSP